MAGLNHHDEPEGGPVTVPETLVDHQAVTKATKDLPVWVHVAFDDGRPARTEEGFALAWTSEHVHVQVRWRMSYYLGIRQFWVPAHQVTRRVIEPQWIGRPGTAA